jgi:hypothetical protein
MLGFSPLGADMKRPEGAPKARRSEGGAAGHWPVIAKVGRQA